MCFQKFVCTTWLACSGIIWRFRVSRNDCLFEVCNFVQGKSLPWYTAFVEDQTVTNAKHAVVLEQETNLVKACRMETGRRDMRAMLSD